MALNTNKRKGDKLHAEEWNELAQEVQGKQPRLNIVDALDSTSSADVLSAKQGKILNNKIEDTKAIAQNVEAIVKTLPVGYFYGTFTTKEELPSEFSEKGYAYIGTAPDYVIYTYEPTIGWKATENKYSTPTLETNLGTKSQTKAPTTKAVQEGIEAIDVTLARSSEDDNELTKAQKYNASANINDRIADTVPVTGEVKALGYKVLNPNKSFAEQITDTNTIYEIKDEFDLNDSTFSIPNNVYFKFNGGKLKNGKLIGKLLSTSKEIDVSWLGIIYNDNTNNAALNNGVTLSNMLSGITNEVYLKLSSDFYIKKSLDSSNEPLRNLYINGYGNTIFSYNFCGFSVNKSIKIENLKFIAADFKTGDGGAFFVRFTNTSLNEPRQIIVKDSYFSGRCRIISASEISDANLFEYFSYIRIQNNTFENVICTIGGNALFYFSNTNFELLEVTNNIVHNFYSKVIDFSLTNDSSYVDYIEDFYLKKYRRISILNNLVYNDIDLKPWEYHPSTYTYIEFIGGEIGDCVFDNNTISNIIANNSNTAVYPAYLSVNNLVETNNVISNIYNLTGAYNNFLKAKGGGGVRIYKNNKFINEDLSDIYDNVDFSTIQYILYDFMEPLDTLILSNNIFNVKSLWININYQLKAMNLVIDANVFNVDNMSAHERDDALFTNKQENSISSIKNNILKVNTNHGLAERIPSLFCIDDIENTTVSVCNNRTENSLAFIITTTVKTGKSNTIENNFSTINPLKITTKATQQLVSRDGNFEGFNMKNNYIETSTGLSSTTILYGPSNLKGNLSFTLKADYPIMLIRGFSVPTSMKKLLIKCYDKNKTKLILNSEFNIIPDGNGSYYYTGITHNNGYLNGKATTRTNLKNFIDENYFYVQLYNNDISFNSVFYQDGVLFEVSIADISSNTLSMIPEKGTTETRPTTSLTSANVGFKYFDTNLGKPIYWNGTTWIDGNGKPIGLQVKDTTVLLEADASSSKTINVYSSSAITATAQNPDGSITDLWLTASVGTLTNGAYPVTLTATSANSTNPRGAKVIIENGTDVVIINVVQNYSTT